MPLVTRRAEEAHQRRCLAACLVWLMPAAARSPSAQWCMEVISTWPEPSCRRLISNSPSWWFATGATSLQPHRLAWMESRVEGWMVHWWTGLIGSRVTMSKWDHLTRQNKFFSSGHTFILRSHKQISLGARASKGSRNVFFVIWMTWAF